MSDSDWQEQFRKLFHAGVKKYQAGHTKAAELVDQSGRAYLESIGYTEQEFFDFIEDFARGGEPTLETALELASIRRDYFLKEQAGRHSSRTISMDDLPSKDATVEGIEWLPRLLSKAEAKLRGEMPPDLMYGCGGDRKFFHSNGIGPAEFLRQVRQAKGDHAAVIGWVKKNRKPNLSS